MRCKSPRSPQESVQNFEMAAAAVLDEKWVGKPVAVR